ncbi:hypothetical protein [Acidobacterium sp. S8]|uniref:hypothetical protein n=1 Tax=Acidobacterium sp. S8 TaxID=1641854 RepID=UPI00131C7302|nr:hypothetical protein [Acidobacterium sp. S8]
MRIPKLNFILWGFIAAIVCTGCSTSTIPTSTTSTQAMLSARVMGGRKPVSGSSILLVEAGTFGKTSSATLARATSDANGNFSITSFSCRHAPSQLYITASGGDAGNGVNANIFLIAMLGPCNNLPNNVVINELSTVAAAYTFAQFMNPQNPAQIGTIGIPRSTQYIGMINSGLTLATNVIDIASGKPAKFLSTSPNSPETLNTLADILVYCVNSPSPFSNCNTLYSAVSPPAGGSAPTNTLQAALDIALSPGKNVAAIYDLLSHVPVALPYNPVLPTAPNDLLLALKFVPGDISTPRGMAIDQAGDIWIANSTGGSSTLGSITELNPVGVEISPSGGYKPAGLNHPEELFFDTSGKIWITNFVGNTVEAIDSSGKVVVAPFGSTAFFNPTSIVADSFSQLWIADSETTNTARELSVSTTAGDFSFWVGGFGLGTASCMTADTTVLPNIIWVSNTGTGGVSQIVDYGILTLTGAVVSGGGQGAQQGITVDNDGDVWVANTTGSVTKIHDSAIPVVTLGPVAVGGITSTSQPWGITTDSANHVWVNNFGNDTVTELDTNGNAFSPSGGFTAGGLIKFPRNGIAVDRSGNVWVLDDDNPPAFVTELLGAASPVATPRVSGRPVAP